MRGWARRRGGLIVTVVLACVTSWIEVGRAAGAAEVQVRSRGTGASAITTVAVQTSPSVRVVDRTPGAMPAAAGAGGPASRGVTFGGEVRLSLDGAVLGREAAVEVADDLVSSVRMFPELDGATVVVFVRRPVTYSVSQPSGAGEVTIELRGRRLTVAAEPPVRTTPGVLPGLEAPPPPSAAQVALDAAEVTYDRETDTLIARGGVTLTRGEFSLRADEVRYDRTNGVAEASGDVVMTDPDATLEGEAAYVDLVDETGWIEDVEADMTLSRYILSAGRLTKRGGPIYRVTDGIFTTCRCGGLEKPSWSIAGERTDVELGGLGVVRNATLRVKDVPVAWLPVFAFPANNERQSGFLMPRFGFSNRRGFQYEQPFFWAINKSADLTVGLDVETEARIGALGEFRYLLSKKAQGNFSWAYYNESIRKADASRTVTPTGVETDAPENRYIVAGHHEQPFYGKSQYYLDVFNVSDDTVLREVDNLTSVVEGNLRLRSTRFTRSRTGLVKTWNGGVVQVEPAYYQDLINPQELVPQPLPRLRAQQQMPFLGGRVIGRVQGSMDYFLREEGFDGARFNVAPELVVPFRWGRWVNGSVSGLVRETAYQLGNEEQIALAARQASNDPSSIARSYFVSPRLPALDKTHTRETAEVSARLGTELSRVYDFPHFGFSRLRHSIEPETRYLYVPEVDPQLYTLRKPNCRTPGRACTTLFSRGFLFDELDAINERNFFSYGFTTRLLARTARPAKPLPRPPVVESEDQREDVGTDSADDGILDGDEEEAVWEEGEDDEEDWTSPEQRDEDAERGIVRPEGDVRELLRFSLLHGADVTRRLVDDSHFSDIDYMLQLRPIYWFGLNYSGTVNFEEERLLAQVVGFSFREPGWRPARNSLQVPSGVSVNYRFVEENVNENRSGLSPTSPEVLLFQNTGVDQVTGSVYLRLGDYFGFGYLGRYVFNTVTVFNQELAARDFGPGFIEQVYLFRILSRCDCWAIDFAFQDRADTDERLFRVQLTLVGLGSTGQGSTGRTFGGFTSLRQQGIGNQPLFGRHDWD
jgi:LPS-assembly protein